MAYVPHTGFPLHPGNDELTMSRLLSSVAFRRVQDGPEVRYWLGMAWLPWLSGPRK